MNDSNEAFILLFLCQCLIDQGESKFHLNLKTYLLKFNPLKNCFILIDFQTNQTLMNEETNGNKSSINKQGESGINLDKNSIKTIISYPDYLLEVEPPNSSQVFSRKIEKRSEDMNSLNAEIYTEKSNSTKYLELSVFVDFKAYENFQTNGLIETEEQFHELILCYINQIQAIYSHKSFDRNFVIHLVKIELQKTEIFDKTDGNRDLLLKKFCEYQSDLNPSSDFDPFHWDMALLLTGHDLYVVRDDGTRDYKSLGLGSVSGICTLERNCVISEFETINTFGELWPSSGLMSTWAAAHEMAHK